jgi:hypothetical protein
MSHLLGKELCLACTSFVPRHQALNVRSAPLDVRFALTPVTTILQVNRDELQNYCCNLRDRDSYLNREELQHGSSWPVNL